MTGGPHAHEVELLLRRVGRWAAAQPGVHGLALVGSWARDEANQDSDVDLVLLVDSPERYLTDDAWVKDLGAGSIIRTESWGAVTEQRLALDSGLELDLGVAPPSWAATNPVDPGTARVVSEGIRIVFDRDGSLARLAAEIRHQATTAPENRSFAIRAALPGDEAAILSLLAELGYPSSGDELAERIALIREHPADRVLVAEADGEVGGLAALHVIPLLERRPLCRLTAIVVADRLRGRGIGRALVQRVEEEARAAGCDRLEVTTSERRDDAHAFYRQLGFAEEPRRLVKRLSGYGS